MIERQEKNRRRFSTGIPVMVVCFLMSFICLGFCSSTKSLFLSAITDALDMSRGVFSINDSCRFIATAFVNLFFGRLIGRLGAKKLAGIGYLFMIAYALIFAYAEKAVVFYLGGFCLGVGLAWTTNAFASYLVNRWFTRNRGAINGLVLSANGLGGAVAAQVLTPIIYEDGNAFGYRNAYRLIALLLVIVAVLALIFIREPKECTAAASEKGKHKENGWAGLSLSEALKQPYFYAAAVGIFLIGTTLVGISGIYGAYFRDVQIPAASIATIASVHSLVLCFAKFIAGWSYDRKGLSFTLLLCQICGLLSFAAMLFAGSDSFGIFCAYGWGVLSSLALPLETVMISFIVTELFGEKDYARLLGIFFAFNTAGYALGSPVFNLVYDWLGSYRPVLYVVIPMMAAIIVCYQFVIRAAKKLRESEEPAKSANPS